MKVAAILVGLAFLLLPCVAFGQDGWTIAVYMAADNSLKQEAIADLEEMVCVGRIDGVNVVVQYDTSASGAERRILDAGYFRLLEDLGEIDSGDPATLSDFAIWAALQFTSRHYMLVVWDHGNGWFNSTANGPSKPPRRAISAIGYDSHTGSWIGVANGDLRTALDLVRVSIGKPLDILCMDACSMQLLEVLGEAEGDAEFMVASEGIVPLQGLPYDLILEGIRDNTDVGPESLASAIVGEYVDEYEGKEPAVLSALNVDSTCGALSLIRDFASAARRISPSAGLAAVRDNVQEFQTGITPPDTSSDYVDLIHLLSLADTMVEGDVADKGREAAEKLKAAVVACGSTGAELGNAMGIAVWFPSRYEGFVNHYLDYVGLRFSMETSWEKFLFAHYGVPDTLPPLAPVLSVSNVTNHSCLLSWDDSYDLTGIDHYEIRHLLNLREVFSDGAEEGSSAWDLDTFFISSGKAHSGSNSYFSHKGTMTYGSTMDAAGGAVLSFYYLISSTEASDRFYVEISEECSGWQPTFSVDGTSETWKRAVVDLSESGCSDLGLRFRFDSDGASDKWVFIDDILAVAADSIKMIADDASGTLWPVYNLTMGEHGFQALAVDSFDNRSRWSEVLYVSESLTLGPFSMPNPFRGRDGTNIVVELNELSSGSGLSIYSVSGRLVRRFPLSSRFSVIRWDGTDSLGRPLASGVYFLKPSSGATGKATILR